MKNLLKSKAGFTLVELMVVVAIIGILSAVAIPQYSRFQARARQSEAKTTLSGMYMALTSFMSEKGGLTSCLDRAGYEMPANQQHYYTAGFGAVPALNLCGNTGASSCLEYNWNPNGTNIGGNCSAALAAGNQFVAATVGVPTTVTQAPLAGWVILTQTTFLLGAHGNIRLGTAANAGDTWTINEAKTLLQTEDGIQ